MPRLTLSHFGNVLILLALAAKRLIRAKLSPGSSLALAKALAGFMSASQPKTSPPAKRDKPAKKSRFPKHEDAQKQAEILSYRAELLTVLLNHKVYPKIASQINDIQGELNSVRQHVTGSLKQKERQKIKWKESQESHFGTGMVIGFVLGFLAALLLLLAGGQTLTTSSRPASSPFDTPRSGR